MLEEIERWARRGRVSLLVLPLLIFVGWDVGAITFRILARSGAAPVRVESGTTPRIAVDALNDYADRLRNVGERTRREILLYQDHIEPVEHSLVRRGVARTTARRVAWPLVNHSHRRELDPATVLAVLLVESEGHPKATSPVGARGLMQVMPLHAGRWRGCEGDLYDIESNLCYGTSILAWYLRRYNGDERRALLGYNGCVRGTFTPDCWRYPQRVRNIRRQIEAEWTRAGAAGRAATL